jgi:hypothetical protein
MRALGVPDMFHYQSLYFKHITMKKQRAFVVNLNEKQTYLAQIAIPLIVIK